MSVSWKSIRWCRRQRQPDTSAWVDLVAGVLCGQDVAYVAGRIVEAGDQAQRRDSVGREVRMVRVGHQHRMYGDRLTGRVRAAGDEAFQPGEAAGERGEPGIGTDRVQVDVDQQLAALPWRHCRQPFARTGQSPFFGGEQADPKAARRRMHLRGHRPCKRQHDREATRVVHGALAQGMPVEMRRQHDPLRIPRIRAGQVEHRRRCIGPQVGAAHDQPHPGAAGAGQSEGGRMVGGHGRYALAAVAPRGA
jgi:hypothetical protein